MSKSSSDENKLVEIPHSPDFLCQQEGKTRWQGQSDEHLADLSSDLKDETVMSRTG